MAVAERSDDFGAVAVFQCADDPLAVHGVVIADDDPHLSLTDVQWVLGHAHLTTTQLYLRSRPDEVIAKVLEHHRARAERPPAPRVPPGAPGYPADVLEALLGGGRRG